MGQIKQNKIADFFDNHKLLIGGLLLLMVVLSGAFLLWRENFWKPQMEQRIVELENKINNLEANREASVERADIDKLISLSSGNEPEQTEEVGIVAGVSIPIPKPSLEIADMVNINTASAKDFESLPGIGPVYAGRIIEYRNSNGPFKSINDLKKIKGIGEKTFDKFKDKIVVK